MTPTQRSLNRLRKDGWNLVQVVEKWNVHARVRQDLFGFADVVAVSTDTVLLVQACAGASVANRVAKLLNHPNVPLWLESPNRRLEVHGWRKVGAAGKRKRWECRVVCIGMFNGEVFSCE